MAVTKRQVLEALNKLTFDEIINLGDNVVVTPEDMKEFIEKSIVQIDARNEKAAERAKAKRQAGDDLKVKIKEVLSDTPMTVADIVAALDDEEITPAMVVARLGQLVKNSEITKGEIKIDNRNLKTYVLA